MPNSLIVEDFARLFGSNIEHFDLELVDFIQTRNFSYSEQSCEQRDLTILEVLRRLDSGELTKSGPEGRGRWETGWAENLRLFEEGGVQEDLMPKYYRPQSTLRLDRKYVTVSNPFFESDFFLVLRLWLLKKYVKPFSNVYEFGCGPGHNLHAIASMYPQKQIHGLDWSNSAIELVNGIGKKLGMQITGSLFDMFSPDFDLNLRNDSVVLTIGAFEQLGNNFKPFASYLIEKSPSLVVHLEPCYEMYDEGNLLDYLAMKYLRARNYLIGLLPYLVQKEREGSIKILKQQRMYFGGLFHDAWSIIVWEPSDRR